MWRDAAQLALFKKLVSSYENHLPGSCCGMVKKYGDIRSCLLRL
jgi:hypothetical protein